MAGRASTNTHACVEGWWVYARFQLPTVQFFTPTDRSWNAAPGTACIPTRGCFDWLRSRTLRLAKYSVTIVVPHNDRWVGEPHHNDRHGEMMEGGTQRSLIVVCGHGAWNDK